MSQDTRMDRVEKSLTPKQAVVLWLQEIQPYRNPLEYVQYLRSLPESAAPITRLTGQIDQAVRKAMKGSPKAIVETAVRRAVRDVVFLVKLHLQVNFKVMSDQRAWGLMVAMLAEMQNSMLTENTLRNVLHDIAVRVNFEMPYPLDADTAALVEAATKHHVTTWEQLEEDDIRCWVFDNFVKKGAKDIPYQFCEYPDNTIPLIKETDLEAARACFRSEGDFELFRTGKDFTNGLASVTDVEFNAHYDRMVTAFHELVDSGQVKEGALVNLDTVPIPFLKEVPLVDGEWLDRFVAELAVWGGLLKAKGYKPQDIEDGHPLAPVVFVAADGKEIEQAEVQALRGKATKGLAKFPGRTRKFEGRAYINFEGFRRRRKVRADRVSDVKRGLITASWNSWVDAHGGEGVASVAGVPVKRLYCYVDEYAYHISRNADKLLQRRDQLLEGTLAWKMKPERRAEGSKLWKVLAETFIVEPYSFQEAVDSIRQRYFDGAQIMFPDLEEYLAKLIKEAEEVVGMFNDLCTEEMEPSYHIDLEQVRKNAGKKAAEQMVYLVDMAKAEALDCLGDQKAAIEVAGRHL